MTLANYLYALVYSDMYDENDWQMWGQELLVNAEFDDTEWVMIGGLWKTIYSI